MVDNGTNISAGTMAGTENIFMLPHVQIGLLIIIIGWIAAAIFGWKLKTKWGTVSIGVVATIVGFYVMAGLPPPVF